MKVGGSQVLDDSVSPAKSGARHQPPDTAGTTLRLTLSEYATDVYEAPQPSGTHQEVRAHSPEQLHP